MPGTTPNYGLKYSLGVDEVRKFPTEVSEQATKKTDEVLGMFGEKILTTVKYLGSATLKSGELAFQGQGAATFTLPNVVTKDQLVGAVCQVGIFSCKITAPSGLIYGDFINNAATITIAERQHVILQSNGINWYILAGEPMREQSYVEGVEITRVEAEAGKEASATRPALVTACALTAAASYTVGTAKPLSTLEVSQPITFFLPPGVKWKANKVIIWSYILL